MSTPDRARVLVVDDDAAIVAWLVEELNGAGYAATGATSGSAALAALETEAFSLVVSDVEMPEMRGVDLLAAIHRKHPRVLVLLVTAFGSIDLAVRALREGACDFVTKPFRIEELLHAIARALRERQMRREIVRLRDQLARNVGDDGDLVARSEPMRRALDLARRLATSDSTVLITGESGVGKGAIARFVHQRGPRASKPFVQVNCAAVPSALFESELFGVRKGAFTGANESRQGLIQRAEGGTLFLDEIGELPLEAQAKLLHVLETGKVRAVGATDESDAHVRIIAATNTPLEDALRERRFRPDLYYRLNVLRIEIPPLRERREDIPGLVDVMIHRFSERMGRPVVGASAEAMRWMLSCDWPGNVRELANLIERAVALTDHDTIVLDELTAASGTAVARDFLADAVAQGIPLAEVERAYVQRVLEACEGNKARAARILGIDRRTLYRKVEGTEE